jgi:hypothetical protein
MLVTWQAEPVLDLHRSDSNGRSLFTKRSRAVLAFEDSCLPKAIIHELLHTTPDPMADHSTKPGDKDPTGYPPYDAAENCITCDGKIVQ